MPWSTALAARGVRFVFSTGYSGRDRAKFTATGGAEEAVPL
jgi:hypothetical protein